MKILILAANPRRDLALDEEIRDLRDVIERASQQEQFSVDIRLAVRPGDLQDVILKAEPQLIHFCGHGTGEQGLVFQGDRQTETVVSTAALSNLFACFQQQLGCVVLNACYSSVQAEAIGQHIRYVIGMQQEIRDDAAIQFSMGFYRALGYGRPVEAAYQLGINAIQLGLSQSGGIEALSRKTSRIPEGEVDPKRLPEHLKPVLRINTELESFDWLSQPTAGSEAPALEQVLQEEKQFQVYKQQVRDFLSDRRLSEVEQLSLENLRQDLGIAEADAQNIIEAELLPIQQSQEQYRKTLCQIIQQQGYPIPSATKQELKSLAKTLCLTSDEVFQISQPIFVAAKQPVQHLTGVLTTGVSSTQEKELALSSTEEAQSTEPGLDATTLPLQSKQIEFAVVSSSALQSATVRGFTQELVDGCQLEMVVVPGGTYLMGSPEGVGRRNEQPRHVVQVAGFAMGQYAVTQAQWHAIAQLPKINCDLLAQRCEVSQLMYPIVGVSWFEAVEFCDRLSQYTQRRYRLPHEAEWEYACRAGTMEPFCYGLTLTQELACYDNTSESKVLSFLSRFKSRKPEGPEAGGNFSPNRWGLYDMHGNVWEWCGDGWHPNYVEAPEVARVWRSQASGEARVCRGGSWSSVREDCRSAARSQQEASSKHDDIGFRVVCETS